jgi:hypothetical protein
MHKSNVLELFPIPNPKHEILDSVELWLVKCHMVQSRPIIFLYQPFKRALRLNAT